MELTLYAAKDANYRAYLLLLDACRRVVQESPSGVQELGDPDVLLEKTLETLGEAIIGVMPLSEFKFYTPASQPRKK